MQIRVEHLSKRFGAFTAVDHVDFTVPDGALAALLGPSGSGKSTLLRLLAGLETPDAGRIWFGDTDVTRLDPRVRGIGFVFQHYALFSHLTVAENVAFGLTVRGVPRAARDRRVAELLARVGLAELGGRHPGALSGGQRQRVALARALAPAPRLLLLDEPFGAVDARVRDELRTWLRRLHDEVGVTSLFVTHDQEEAFSVADRVLVMHRGRIEQAGAPAALLDRPASAFVAGFVGEVSTFAATVEGGVATAGALLVPVEAADGPARLTVRSHEVALWPDGGGVATIERVVHLADRVRIEATVDGAGPLVARLHRDPRRLRGLVPGARVAVEITAARAWPLEADGPVPPPAPAHAAPPSAAPPDAAALIAAPPGHTPAGAPARAAAAWRRWRVPTTHR